MSELVLADASAAGAGEVTVLQRLQDHRQREVGTAGGLLPKQVPPQLEGEPERPGGSHSACVLLVVTFEQKGGRLLQLVRALAVYAGPLQFPERGVLMFRRHTRTIRLRTQCVQ